MADQRDVVQLRLGSAMAGLVAMAMVALPGTAGGQEVQVARTISCADCRIELHRIAVLGTRRGAGIIEGDLTRAARDSRGRYYLTTSYGTTIKVYDGDGTYLTTIGRKGGGPGEYQGIGTVIVARGDTLHVYDQPKRTLTVLSPQYELVRTTSLDITPFFEILELDDRRIVLVSNVRTRERIGYPLHLLTPEGKVVRSFGSLSGEYRPDVPYAGQRAIAGAGGGRVWSAFRNRYVVQLWSVDGRLLKEIHRAADWFPPRMKATPLSTREPPNPLLQAVQQDREGRLWVLTRVGDARWRTAVRPGGMHAQVTDRDAYYDTMIEVFDGESGELLASRRVGRPFSGFIGHRSRDVLLGALFMDADFIPYFGVWQLQLDLNRGGS